MAIFSEGPGFQTYTVQANVAVQIFNGLGQGGTAIAGAGVAGTAQTVRNPTVFNAGTVPIYVGSTAVTIATGYVLQPGQQWAVLTAPGTAAYLATPLYGITAAGSGSAIIYSGFASQIVID